MTDLEVVRFDTEHLWVKGRWFSVHDVADAALSAVVAAGSRNPAFDMPPFCYSGCPYADAILALGCDEISPAPDTARAMLTPHDGKKPARCREPIWPEVFGVDQDLYERGAA